MTKKVKEIRYCQAWASNTNAQCKYRAIRGTNYCWWHYPKKALVFELLIVLPLTLILTLLFNGPLIWFLSKVPVLHRLDKNAPLIESVSPDIRKSPNVDKRTDVFNAAFLEEDSGIDYKKSDIKISYKDNQKNVSLKGKVNKTASEISFLPEKELQYGEYLLEVLLVDKANNKNEFMKSFVVRERDELTAFVCYDTYENASDSDRKIFNSFLEDEKDLLEHFNLYIYKLTIGNKDDIAVLKDVYLAIDISGGGVFLCWEQIGNFKAKRFGICSVAESLDKRMKGHVYGPQSFLNIDEIGSSGFATFFILAGQSKLLPEPEEKIWEGIEIHGTYLSEG